MHSITNRPRAQLLHLNQAGRSDFDTSGDDSIRVAREQIAKMRDDYAKERRGKLGVALSTVKLAPDAKRYLDMAFASQQAFERSAMLPPRYSDEIRSFVKNVAGNG